MGVARKQPKSLMARQPKSRSLTRIEVNRAPVPTLWATMVPERLGFSCDEALKA
jgi:hypothetical protein